MYVDASAMVCILANEPERKDFLAAIRRSVSCFTSAVSIFETATSISGLTGSCASALIEIDRFLAEAGIRVAPIDESILFELAIVRDRYGKGSGHPARLNLGDCFSYAMAKRAGAKLLYKGNDFAQTDLA